MLGINNSTSADLKFSGETASYSGPISADLNQQFFAAVKGKTVKRLVITSSGGDVEAGIALGLWVFEHRLNIEVPEYCLSACANYVFPTGQHKSIAAGAIVAWHGNYNHLKQTGLWRDDIPGRMERYNEDAATAEAYVRVQMEKLAELERDFFSRIGVDEYLCWIGKMPPYNVPDYYFLSRQDMARFGVTQVLTPPGYANTDVTDFNGHVMHIKLSESGNEAGK